MSSSLSLLMSVIAQCLRLHTVRTQGVSKACIALKLEGEDMLSNSKEARFIAIFPRSDLRILSASTRSQALVQGGGQMTLGADDLQKARSVRARSLIRRMRRTGERLSGQGGDPPVETKHVRQSLLAVHATLARPLVGGAAGVFGRARACAGMVEMRSY